MNDRQKIQMEKYIGKIDDALQRDNEFEIWDVWIEIDACFGSKIQAIRMLYCDALDNANIKGNIKAAKGVLENYIVDNYNITIADSLESRLHITIKDVAYQKYLDGHFADAVESACKEVNDRLKRLFKKHRGVEKDGQDLFASVFNDNGDKALLKVADLNEQSGKDEQVGYKFLLMGMWNALRNPKAHANLTLTADEAYDTLIFVSMLMKKIYRAFDYTRKQKL